VVNKYSPKRYTQSQLSKIFGLQINRKPSELKFLWHNHTDNTSIRLSLTGYQFIIKEIKIQIYQFDLDRPLSNKNLLQLERFFPGPYYYWSRTSKFIVLDEQDASWLQLMGGDLASYLDNLESNT
jgi:hypothetical protein